MRLAAQRCAVCSSRTVSATGNCETCQSGYAFGWLPYEGFSCYFLFEQAVHPPLSAGKARGSQQVIQATARFAETLCVCSLCFVFGDGSNHNTHQQGGGGCRKVESLLEASFMACLPLQSFSKLLYSRQGKRVISRPPRLAYWLFQPGSMRWSRHVRLFAGVEHR